MRFYFYSGHYCLYFVSMAGGAVTSGSVDESIFLAEVAIVIAVFSVQYWILIAKQNETLKLLNRTCVYSIPDGDDFNFLKNKLEKFIKFASVFLWATVFTCSFAAVVLPFLGSKSKNLMFKIAFPWDWRTSEVAYWSASVYLCTDMFQSITTISSSAIIWYLMLHCSLRYEVLGIKIRNLGQTTDYATENLSKK